MMLYSHVINNKVETQPYISPVEIFLHYFDKTLWVCRVFSHLFSVPSVRRRPKLNLHLNFDCQLHMILAKRQFQIKVAIF